MTAKARRVSRRAFLLTSLAAGQILAEGTKGEVHPSDARRYADPTTELEVYRLTDPAYSSILPGILQSRHHAQQQYPAVLVRPRRRFAGVPHGS